MKFIVHDAALNGDDSVLILIDRLVDRLADEVHLLEIPAVDLLQESKWYRAARSPLQKVLVNSLAKPARAGSVRRGPHLKAVEVLDPESAKLADRLAHTPLKILVEDRESDGVFLDILVEELGWPELRAIWVQGKTVTPCAIELDSAGGQGSIPARVERTVGDARKGGRSIRLFVLCDSDLRWPGDNRSEGDLAAILEVCRKYGVPLHILSKRCAENYIPDAVFEAVREDPRQENHAERFGALLCRSRKQRDHFPLKKGLTSAERGEAVNAGLYDTSEAEDLKLLERPLLPGRPRPLLLLERERRMFFTAEGLRERDGEGELDQLLIAIAAEL